MQFPSLHQAILMAPTKPKPKTEPFEPGNYERLTTKRYTGKLKWLDTEGFGYIIRDNDFEEIFVNPSSFGDINDEGFGTVREGDKVEFGLMVRNSNPCYKAINVVPFGPQCYACDRIGHYANKCPETYASKARCFRCGIVGHLVRDCWASCSVDWDYVLSHDRVRVGGGGGNGDRGLSRSVVEWVTDEFGSVVQWVEYDGGARDRGSGGDGGASNWVRGNGGGGPPWIRFRNVGRDGDDRMIRHLGLGRFPASGGGGGDTDRLMRHLRLRGYTNSDSGSGGGAGSRVGNGGESQSNGIQGHHGYWRFSDSDSGNGGVRVRGGGDGGACSSVRSGGDGWSTRMLDQLGYRRCQDSGGGSGGGGNRGDDGERSTRVLEQVGFQRWVSGGDGGGARDRVISGGGGRGGGWSSVGNVGRGGGCSSVGNGGWGGRWSSLMNGGRGRGCSRVRNGGWGGRWSSLMNGGRGGRWSSVGNGGHDGQSTGSVVSVKRKEDVTKVEEVEDCFILDFDPRETGNVGCVGFDEDDDDDDSDGGDDGNSNDDDRDDDLKGLSLVPIPGRKISEDVKKLMPLLLKQIKKGFREGRLYLKYPGDDSDDDDEDCEEIRPVVCVDKVEDVKKVEEDEDCFILEFDPTEPVKLSNLSLCASKSEDVSILAENGQVACRDYPHPRHLCATHPFKKTSHKVHCKLCYCYICDIPAPCAQWAEGLMHCHATDEYEIWRRHRDLMKKRQRQIS